MNRAQQTSSSSGDDRRATCRYTVVQTQAWLGWWEGEEFRSVSCEIIDISLRGARLVVEAFPPNVPSVWFTPPHVSTSTPNEWLEARVVDARKRLLGPRQVRIAFRQTFPYEDFKAVVYGPQAVGGARSHLWIPEGANEKEGADLW
jgi:hypothetical protein